MLVTLVQLAALDTYRNGRMENSHTEPADQRGYDQHHGSHHWEYIDCTVSGAGFGRDRSDGYYAEGGGADSPGQLTFYARAAHEARTHINQQHYVNVSNTNHIYRILDDGDEANKYLTFEDVWAEDDGSINQFFNFWCDSGTMGLEILLNTVTINGMWITDSN